MIYPILFEYHQFLTTSYTCTTTQPIVVFFMYISLQISTINAET